MSGKIAKTTDPSIVSARMLGDIRKMIEETRGGVIGKTGMHVEVA